jgi:hypothetical protein
MVSETMTDSLQDEEIRAAAERAFRPLRCVAEIWDYDAKIRFKVFDANDRGILEAPSLVLRELRDKSNLRSVLSAARAAVEEKGFRLEPWTL